MIPNILNAIDEIKAVEFDHPSDWLDALKDSAIESIRTNNIYIDDDYQCCEMQPDEYGKFKEAIKKEAHYHDQWDVINLERRIVRNSKEYVDLWNKIIEILMKYDKSGMINNKWLQTPVNSSVLIDKFCHYDLPSDAVIGGEWNLPKWYIYGKNNPEAPYWDFEFSEFNGYIKSVSVTEDQNILKVEYWIYRRNVAHCDGYYGLWDTGKAMVDVETHRRWNVE